MVSSTKLKSVDFYRCDPLISLPHFAQFSLPNSEHWFDVGSDACLYILDCVWLILFGISLICILAVEFCLRFRILDDLIFEMSLFLMVLFRKIPRDLTEASLSGAGLSIVAALFMMFLFGMVNSLCPVCFSKMISFTSLCLIKYSILMYLYLPGAE